MLEKIASSRITMVPFLISVVIGGVISIAAGFYGTYLIVAFIGNN